MCDDDTDLLMQLDLNVANLNELAAVLDSRVVPGVIGVEGPPFAGKTTFATKLASRLGASLIPEHTDFDQYARDLALSPWPEDSVAATARQAHFYRVERKRTRVASEVLAQGLPVVMDRTTLSVVVYSLARAVTTRIAQSQGLRDLEILMKDTEVRFPQVLYLLQVPTSVLLQRSSQLAATGKPREIEPYLLLPSTLRILKYFYANITSRLRHCNVIVKSGFAVEPEFGG